MKKLVFFASVSAAAFVAATAAQAQAQAPADGATVEGIIVTGSRIARRDYASASPIVTVGQDQLSQTATVNVEATLNQLPQFAQGQNQSAIGAVANGGRASLNLRGLGETRNLVLLDGRRLPLSSAFGVVDVNIIPPSILEGVETISGGASAVYGSDAISGVVNFKTKRQFEGLQIDARYGNAFAGSPATTDVSLTAGLASSDDRARALMSLGYSSRDVLWGYKRPEFFSLGVLSSFIGQGTYVTSATNLPSQAAVNSVFAGYGVAPGTVLNSRNLGFNDDGTLFAQIGVVNYKGPTTEFFSTTGGTVRQPVTFQEYLVQPMERRNFFGKFEYDVTDSVTAYAQLLHVKSKVTGQVGWSPTVFVIPSMPVTNPFIPAPLRTILASRPNPTADFTLNDRFMGFEDRKFISDSTTDQFIVGLKGKLPIQDWTYDIYGLHGTVDIVETQDKALLLSKMQSLFYAADGGRAICAGGFNPFGLANATSVSKACRDYIETETHDVTHTQQDIVEATIGGRLFALPAGDARFSATGAYREDSFEFDPDNARENNDIIGTLTTAPSEGSVSVKEAAIELLLPVFKDMPFAQSFDLSLGYRISDYDVSGSFSTYKIDGIWKPVESLSFRGGFERAIRAPNIGELYSSALAAQAQIGSPPGGGDPCDIRSTARTTGGANVRALCVATGVPAAIVDTYQYTTVAIGSVSRGSTALTPEEADTFTAGAVWRPRFDNPWLSGLSLSVDYYDIQISNVISQVSAVTTMNKCYNLDGTNPTYSASNLYCALVARDATGGISSVSTPYLNLGGLKTKGVDVQGDLRWNLSDLGLGDNAGSLTLNTVISFNNSYQVQILPNSQWTEYVGTIDGTQAATTPPVGLPLPDWKSVVGVTYANGPAEVGLRWRHLPKMKDVTSVTRPASPAAGVPKYDIVDLNLGWKFTDKLSVRGGVTNLFDKDPPVVGGTLGQTQPGTYDIIGRSFYLSLSARF